MTTEQVDLLVIARLDGPDGAAADLYVCELYCGTTEPDGKHTHGHWWESLPVGEGTPVTIDAVDETLTGNGYTRVTDWTQRTTASGCCRYFAQATIAIDDV